MNIENLLQLGFAGAVATYLVYWITRKQDGKLDKIIDIQENIVRMLEKER